jgi:hypothetical protein
VALARKSSELRWLTAEGGRLYIFDRRRFHHPHMLFLT